MHSMTRAHIFDAITRVSLTGMIYIPTNGQFKQINASVHLRIASTTLLRGEEDSSSRREVLVIAEGSSHHRGGKLSSPRREEHFSYTVSE